MRLYEFASAEEQLALLRLIIDNTWSAISQQAAQENKEKEAKRAKAALKPKRKGVRKLAKSKPVPLVPPPVKPPKPPTLASLPPANPKPTPTQPPAYPKPTPTQLQPNPLTKSTPVHTAAQTTNASFGSKDAGFGRNNSNLKNADYGDDRYSKNGIRTPKKLPRIF